MGQKVSLNFYFDFISPFSYLAFEELKLVSQKLSQEKIQLEINYYPVILSKILDHHQIKGPALVQPKREFLLKQTLRQVKDRNILFQGPPRMPFNSLWALRISLKEVWGEHQFQAIDLLWKKAWAEGKSIEELDAIECIFAEEVPNLWQKNQDKALNRLSGQILKSNTESAIQLGVFGVPTMLVGDELYWGHDAIGTLLQEVVYKKVTYCSKMYQQCLEKFSL